MVKVRISYQKPQELDAVLKLMKPIIKSYKTEKGSEGRYKKAYINVKDISDDA